MIYGCKKRGKAMTDAVKTNLPQSVVPDQRQQSESQKMKTRMSWESAYLKEQKSSISSGSVKNYGKDYQQHQAKESSIKKEASAAQTQGWNPLLQKADGKFVATDLHNKAKIQAGTQKGGPHNLFNATVHYGNKANAVERASLKATGSNPLAQKMQQIKLPNFRVVEHQGQIKLWLRTDDKFVNRQKLIKQLQEMFSSMGQKLSQLTINGETVWSQDNEQTSSGEGDISWQ